MKNVLIACVGICMLASCEKDLYQGEEWINDGKFMMQEPFTVPVQNGSIAVVTLGEDTLAITDVPLTINVPLGTSLTRAEGSIEVTYVDYAAMPEFTEGSYVATNNHTLLFEDSKTADYDFNDLILHVRTEENKKVNGAQAYKIYVRGLALGSSKQIGFGVTDRNGVDFDLTDNVRRDYFSNRPGFLNTEAGQAFVPGIVASDADDENKGSFIIHHRSTKGHQLQTGFVEYPQIVGTYTGGGNERKDLKFYIKVDNGLKLYVGEYNAKLEGALPYGIRTDECQNNYPFEKMPIGQAFPRFLDWVKTGSPSGWNSPGNADLSKCYRLDSSELWRW